MTLKTKTDRIAYLCLGKEHKKNMKQQKKQYLEWEGFGDKDTVLLSTPRVAFLLNLW